jgi:hypothetical protein
MGTLHAKKAGRPIRFGSGGPLFWHARGYFFQEHSG